MQTENISGYIGLIIISLFPAGTAYGGEIIGFVLILIGIIFEFLQFTKDKNHWTIKASFCFILLWISLLITIKIYLDAFNAAIENALSSLDFF